MVLDWFSLVILVGFGSSLSFPKELRGRYPSLVGMDIIPKLCRDSVWVLLRETISNDCLLRGTSESRVKPLAYVLRYCAIVDSLIASWAIFALSGTKTILL